MSDLILRGKLSNFRVVIIPLLLILISACGSSSQDDGPLDDELNLPTVPTNLQFSLNPSNEAELTWDASTDDDGVRGYEIRKNGVMVGEFNVLSYFDNNLDADTNYTYTVAAIDSDGNKSAAATISFLTEPDSQTDIGLPSKPGDMRYQIYSVSQAEIFWNGSTDDNDVIGYEITRNGTVIGTVSTLSHLDDGLSPGVPYSYTVTAIDDEGNRSEAASVSLTTGNGTAGDIAPSPTNAKLVFYAPTLTGIFWDTPPESAQVVAVEIIREGELIGVSESNRFYDDTRADGINYRYMLIAIDGNGNRSAPATIGYIEDQKLVNGSGDAGWTDNNAIAISKDTAIIGADDEGYANYNGMGNIGAAYVFTRSEDGNWGNSQRLESDRQQVNYEPNDFGHSVAVSGDTLVVGERTGDFGTRGVVHVYSSDGDGFWSRTQKLTANEDQYTRYYYDDFGHSIALEGDTLLASARYERNGVVLVFVRDEFGQWTKTQTLEPNDADDVIQDGYESGFGTAISIEGNTAVIGSDWEDALQTHPAYVFTRDSSGIWSQHQKLLPDVSERSWGGSDSVAIEGDTIALSSFNGSTAHIFSRDNDGQWSESQIINVYQGPNAFEPQYNYDQSVALALDNGTLLLGSRYDDGLNAQSGSAYVYKQDTSGIWAEVLKLSASDGEPGTEFGRNVALDGNLALISANPYREQDSYNKIAAAYVFTLPSADADPHN